MSHLIWNLALLMAAVSAAYLLFKAIQSICSKKTRVEPNHKNRGLPAFNVDGTPMMGAFDMNGNPYGIASSMFNDNEK